MERFSLRIYFNGKSLGPGKVELLERIAEYGSIAAAGVAGPGTPHPAAPKATVPAVNLAAIRFLAEWRPM